MLQAQEVGKYRVGQISLLFRGLELLGPVPAPAPHFFVTREKSSIEVKQGESELLAGLIQIIELVIHSGSYAIKEVKFCLINTTLMNKLFFNCLQ